MLTDSSVHPLIHFPNLLIATSQPLHTDSNRNVVCVFKIWPRKSCTLDATETRSLIKHACHIHFLDKFLPCCTSTCYFKYGGIMKSNCMCVLSRYYVFFFFFLFFSFCFSVIVLYCFCERVCICFPYENTCV